LIDATWSFAKSLYNKNTWLTRIPNVVLTPVNQPIYSALRKPPKDGLVSTGEALIILLENLGDLDSSAQLRRALQFAVDAEPWQKEHFKN
jgi:DTW domain-containing protein YfiP